MQHALLSHGPFMELKVEDTCYLAGIFDLPLCVRVLIWARRAQTCDSMITYCTQCNILPTQWTKSKATTLIQNFPAIATFYRDLQSGLFSLKRQCFGMSANFLFAVAHFQVILFLFIASLLLFYLLGRGRVCQSHIWNVGKRRRLVDGLQVWLSVRLPHLSLLAALWVFFIKYYFQSWSLASGTQLNYRSCPPFLLYNFQGFNTAIFLLRCHIMYQVQQSNRNEHKQNMLLICESATGSKICMLHS